MGESGFSSGPTSRLTSASTGAPSRLVAMAESVTSSRSVKKRGASSRTISGLLARTLPCPTPSFSPGVTR